MLKRIFVGLINGFCYSIAITLLIQGTQIFFAGDIPMLPEFVERFDNPVRAFAFQLLLIGIMSAITSAGTSIFECKKLGLFPQSVIFLIIILAAWIPVACYAWGFHKYMVSMVVTTVCMIATYSVCWIVMYKKCKTDIKEINRILGKE